MKRIKATPELMNRIREARERLNASQQENLMMLEQTNREAIQNAEKQDARRCNIISGRAFPKIRVVESNSSELNTNTTERTNSIPPKRGRLGQQPGQSAVTSQIPTQPALSRSGYASIVEARSGSYSTNPNSFLSGEPSGFAEIIRGTAIGQRTAQPVKPLKPR